MPWIPLHATFLVSPGDDQLKKEDNNQESQPISSGNEQGSNSGFDAAYPAQQCYSGGETLDLANRVENKSQETQSLTCPPGSQEAVASDAQVPESSNSSSNDTHGKTMTGDHVPQGPLTSSFEEDHSSVSYETVEVRKLWRRELQSVYYIYLKYPNVGSKDGFVG